MAQNIEIKARIEDRELILSRARELSTDQEQMILQEDIFFSTSSGRLKLRIFSESEGKLIYYERNDTHGPKASFYTISSTTEPRKLCQVLTQALGVRAVVRKSRTLIMHGRTRIHLDEVEDLGNFLELEVVLDDGESLQVGEKEAVDIMGKLGIEKNSLIDVAYVDLLASKNV